ncbi:DUF429 domain-containing protein [Poseidonibacter ostreae]|jgi:predicted RNase H-like nuclease|uniref:DUF429 domain-containing protein n=1 Tax=Poseidonibacter ostreae TaxID=2654171 RepID=A0A6L4WR99_9BACT|nr:DUF429 domain-containing protein [Poseidonibacter ostreae]KAB7891171.1 DUF429 domain-containing protein [Poseidonibacter ostreae]
MQVKNSKFMLYIGIDLAWSENNYSGVTLLDDNKIIYTGVVSNLNEVITFIKKYPDAILGVDAPLVVNNKTGNRSIEIEFLKDYSSKKLGVYPVNRNLMLKYSKVIVGEELVKNVPQKLGKELFEVYPHATIMNCFHGTVLPYKRKKGRNTEYIREQLKILQSYLQEVVEGDFYKDIDELKGIKLKHYEDMLDSIVCAYTLFYCQKNNYKTYENIFKVPL